MAKPGRKRTLTDRQRAERRDEARARRDELASLAKREIGSIPKRRYPRRYRACRDDLAKFCKTYNPATFCWPWSPDHLEVIAAIEQSVRSVAMLAVALPRGSGKTSICRMAVLWAVSYGHLSYPFVIGANEDKAVETIDAIKLWMRTLPKYVEDFPEVSVPVKALGGIAHRAAGQLCEGLPTFIKWSRTRVVLPTVSCPPNDPTPDGRSVTSGAVLGVSGLTGEGIRGSLFGHPDGRSVRPDGVLLDDPQTDESAKSPQQNADRLALLNDAVLGMAGPGKRVSAIMPCTVIRENDMVDRLLDRKKYPLWRGIRRGLMRTMPTNAAAWERYFDVYRECMGRTVPDVNPANRYYRKHRRELDEGAAAAWKARKGPGEVSAIQHAMNLLCERGPDGFWGPMQNRPKRDDRQRDQLQPAEVTAKVNGVDRGVVPTECEVVTSFVDVHEGVLYATTSAWSPAFAGSVIDYRPWPEQPVRYYSQATAPRKLAGEYPGTGKEGAILAGLTECVDDLIGRTWTREDGAAMRIGRLLVDARFDRDLVCAFCRRSRHAALLMPAMGFYVPRGREWSEFFSGKEGGSTGFHWRIPPPKKGDRVLLTDVNYWKTLARERLRVALGDPGCWSIFGDDQRGHELFADHCCAESATWVEAKGLGRYEWELKPGRPDNHYWDGLVGTAVGAATLGVSIPGTMLAPKRPKRQSLAELKRLSRAG